MKSWQKIGDRKIGGMRDIYDFLVQPTMNRALTESPPPAPLDERPWQFSLLQLFGLTTVVSVGAAAFYWNLEAGMLVSSLLFLSIATYYRAKAVVRTATPNLRNWSRRSVIGLGIATSAVACFVPFFFTCAAVIFTCYNPLAQVASWPFLAAGCFLGNLASLYVLYRSWPRRPAAK